jgi:hypothetical protein
MTAVAPQVEVAHGQTGCLVSHNDMAARTASILQDGEAIDLGEASATRYFDAPHILRGAAALSAFGRL